VLLVLLAVGMLQQAETVVARSHQQPARLQPPPHVLMILSDDVVRLSGCL
jgi:hypothetical protein